RHPQGIMPQCLCIIAAEVTKSCRITIVRLNAYVDPLSDRRISAVIETVVHPARNITVTGSRLYRGFRAAKKRSRSDRRSRGRNGGSLSKPSDKLPAAG